MSGRIYLTVFLFVIFIDANCQSFVNIKFSYEFNWTTYRSGSNAMGPHLQNDSVVVKTIIPFDNNGYGFGFESDLFVKPKLLISFGIGYAKRRIGHETVIERDTIQSAMDIYQSYQDFQIPIILKYVPFERSNVRIDLIFGIIFGYRIKDELRTVDYFFDPPRDITSEDTYNVPGPERIFLYTGASLNYFAHEKSYDSFRTWTSYQYQKTE